MRSKNIPPKRRRRHNPGLAALCRRKAEAMTERDKERLKCDGVLSPRIPCRSMMRLRIRNGFINAMQLRNMGSRGKNPARCPPMSPFAQIDCVQFINGAGGVVKSVVLTGIRTG